MGLIARLRRLNYVYGWRIRYWWLDTPGGAHAHRAVQWVFAAVAIAQLARMALALAEPRVAAQEAFYWWVVQIVIAVISAIVSAALRPKPKPPQPQESKAPTTEDGQTVKHHFGEVWVEDEFILAWKPMGTEPIKSKGGKK